MDSCLNTGYTPISDSNSYICVRHRKSGRAVVELEIISGIHGNSRVGIGVNEALGLGYDKRGRSQNFRSLSVLLIKSQNCKMVGLSMEFRTVPILVLYNLIANSLVSVFIILLINYINDSIALQTYRIINVKNSGRAANSER